MWLFKGDASASKKSDLVLAQEYSSKVCVRVLRTANPPTGWALLIKKLSAREDRYCGNYIYRSPIGLAEFQRVVGVDRICLLWHKLGCISRDDTLRAENTCGPFFFTKIQSLVSLKVLFTLGRLHYNVSAFLQGVILQCQCKSSEGKTSRYR